MTEEWFKWERESTIHSLFMPLEACLKPEEDYFGRGWPDTSLIYKGNVVLWCNRMDKLYEFGQELIDFFLEGGNLENMLSDFEDETAKLKSVSTTVASTNLSNLSAHELLFLYSQFKNQFVKWFAIGMLAEPVALQGEQIILKKTNDKKLISALTSTTKESFSRRQLRELLEIAGKPESGLEKLLDLHAKKYFWLNNNYFKTEVLGKDYFRKELECLLKEHESPEDYIRELKKVDSATAEEKKKAMDILAFDERDRKLVELIDLFGWFQDYRKETLMQAVHHLDVLLKEFGKRSGFTLREMSYTLPGDLGPILEKKFDREEIKRRMKNCLIIWKEHAENYEFYVGEKAIEKEQGLFDSEDSGAEIIEIKGTAACLGKAEGRARVTMSAADAKDILQGEILVTSMTSPDFIVAIKKAAAIVTNEGGITCHAAIISREFGIPCIVGTRIATKAIKTGDYIEVNANHGFVRKIVRGML